MAEEVKNIKETIFGQFKDVFSDGDENLEIMNSKPSVIELMHNAKSIRLSTASNIAFGYGEETKKELHKMVSQGTIKPDGDKATEWCLSIIVAKDL